MKDYGDKLCVSTLGHFLTYPHPEAEAENVQHLNRALPWADSIQTENCFRGVILPNWRSPEVFLLPSYGCLIWLPGVVLANNKNG